MTPGYAVKRWWRACRRPGEPLKVFVRRHGTTQKGTTGYEWLRRKSRSRRRGGKDDEGWKDG